MTMWEIASSKRRNKYFILLNAKNVRWLHSLILNRSNKTSVAFLKQRQILVKARRTFHVEKIKSEERKRTSNAIRSVNFDSYTKVSCCK